MLLLLLAGVGAACSQAVSEPTALRLTHTLCPYRGLSGCLTDLDRKAIAGADAVLVRRSDGLVAARTSTGPDGAFRFPPAVFERVPAEADLVLSVRYGALELAVNVAAKKAVLAPVRRRPRPASIPGLPICAVTLIGPWTTADDGAGAWQDVAVPSEWAGCRVLLRQEQGDGCAAYRLGEVSFGSEPGAKAPLEWEVTDLVAPGRTVRLVRVGGAGPLSLIALPMLSAKRLRAEGAVCPSSGGREVRLHLAVENAALETAGSVAIGLRLTGADGKRASLAAERFSIGEVATGVKSMRIRSEALLPDPAKLACDQPYRLEVELLLGGKCVQRFEQELRFPAAASRTQP